MTRYPPPHHLLTDLGLAWMWAGGDEVRVFAPVDANVRDTTGAMDVGVIAAVIDVAGAQRALAAADGDWIATSDLSFHASEAVREGPLVVSAQLARAGGRVVVIRSTIYDGCGAEELRAARSCGVATMTFSRLRAGDVGVDRQSTERRMGDRYSFPPGPSGFTQPARDAVGVRQLLPGVVEIDKAPYVENSFGTINGGATAIVCNVAAESATGPGYVSVDLTTRYVARADAGPMRTRSHVVRQTDEHAAVEVELVDTSRDDALVALAHVGLRRALG